MKTLPNPLNASPEEASLQAGPRRSRRFLQESGTHLVCVEICSRTRAKRRERRGPAGYHF
jgi:hypothetical protein